MLLENARRERRLLHDPFLVNPTVLHRSMRFEEDCDTEEARRPVTSGDE